MDNQHKNIKGYRDLSQEEIDLMNEGKELAELCGNFVDKLAEYSNHGYPSHEDNILVGHYPDIGWVYSGREDLQVGFMKLIRSIAKPETF